MIGAVNTIIPTQEANGKTLLFGDNTDWIGIHNTVLSKSRDHWKSSDCGLVIGAGGTARAAIFALHKLGLGTIYIWNRTEESARQLAADFPIEFNIIVLGALQELLTAPPAIVVGTIPADAYSEGGLELSDLVFSRPTGGVVVEMAYRPKVTSLLDLAGAVSVRSAGSQWDVVYGVDVLLEQGYQQFELWTRHRAPRRAIRERVMQIYESH